MKAPMVDYRSFRLSKLNEPQFAHLKYLLGWVVYFTLYFLTEALIPADRCYVVHSRLDDLIPFCEVFVIPYVVWYFLIAVTLIHTALYNTENFKRFMTFIIVTQVVAMAIYIIFPNRQDLRPVEFPRDNIFTDIVRGLYRVDTNTNVCPSLHVAYSIGMASAWLKDKTAKTWWKVFMVIAAVTICLSTAFIKQHSVVDAFVALPMCLLAEVIAYGKSYWLPRFKKCA